MGMRSWKRRHMVQSFGPLRFEDDPLKAAADGRPVMVWAGRETGGLRAACDGAKRPLHRVEDGFLGKMADPQVRRGGGNAQMLGVETGHDPKQRALAGPRVAREQDAALPPGSRDERGVQRGPRGARDQLGE